MAEFKEKFPADFLTILMSGTPSFRSMRQTRGTDTYALEQLGVSQIVRHSDSNNTAD